MALTDYMAFGLHGWEFECDHPGCTSQGDYDEKWYPQAEKHLKRDGWAVYGNGTHACPAHVADYIAPPEEVAG